jgi:hypothetical protein
VTTLRNNVEDGLRDVRLQTCGSMWKASKSGVFVRHQHLGRPEIACRLLRSPIGGRPNPPHTARYHPGPGPGPGPTAPRRPGRPPYFRRQRRKPPLFLVFRQVPPPQNVKPSDLEALAELRPEVTPSEIKGRMPLFSGAGMWTVRKREWCTRNRSAREPVTELGYWFQEVFYGENALEPAILRTSFRRSSHHSGVNVTGLESILSVAKPNFI